MIWNRVKHSTIDKLMQYVLIELFRNVFLEKTMIDSKFPINPIVIIETWVIVVANVMRILRKQPLSMAESS